MGKGPTCAVYYCQGSVGGPRASSGLMSAGKLSPLIFGAAFQMRGSIQLTAEGRDVPELRLKGRSVWGGDPHSVRRPPPPGEVGLKGWGGIWLEGFWIRETTFPGEVLRHLLLRAWSGCGDSPISVREGLVRPPTNLRRWNGKSSLSQDENGEGLPRRPGSCFFPQPAPTAVCLKPQVWWSKESLVFPERAPLFPENKQTPACHTRRVLRAQALGRRKDIVGPACGGWGSGGGRRIPGTARLRALLAPLCGRGS